MIPVSAAASDENTKKFVAGFRQKCYDAMNDDLMTPAVISTLFEACHLVNILLEAATFSPAHTSRTSRNLGLMSDSSIRYERRVDDAGIDARSDYAAALISEVAGGTVCAGRVDVWAHADAPAPVLPFRVERFQKMMGAAIPVDFITRSLTRLGCTVAAGDAEGVLRVTVPTFRPDLEREIDLYEEVLRLYGMDRIESTLPAGRGRVGVRTRRQECERIVHRAMTASGLNETMTYSFAGGDDLELLRMREEGMGEAAASRSAAAFTRPSSA